MSEKAREFWETIRSNYAHLKYNWELDKTCERAIHLHEFFFQYLNLENKIILDFGCGGGYVGKYLYEEYGIKKYIAVDIAKRSLHITRGVLRNYEHERYLAPIEFNTKNPDCIICLAVIQHFENIEMLDGFLNNCNNSGAFDIGMMVRWNKETVFNNAYETGIDYGRACMTNEYYISEKLNKYNLYNKSDLFERSKIKYLTYRLK